jgi:hypothetical protein
MARRVESIDRQTDLFTRPADAPVDSLADTLDAHPGEAFIQRIRDDLDAKLALVHAAERFPWSNPTRVYSEEMRVNSMSRWLPRAEAVALRRAFAGRWTGFMRRRARRAPPSPGPMAKQIPPG